MTQNARHEHKLRVPLLTVFAMLAFASKLAAVSGSAARHHDRRGTFTAIRLASGALVLVLLLRSRGVRPTRAAAADGGDVVCLCGVLFLRLPRSHGRDRRPAAVRRRAVHHDGLGPVAGERIAE